MPEIDNDLFKLLVVVLLALSTLLLLAAMSALGGIRKLLKQQVDQTDDLRKDLAAGTSAGPLPAATSTGDDFPAPAPAPVEEPAPAVSPEPAEPAEPSYGTPVLGGAAAATAPSEAEDRPAPATESTTPSASESWGLDRPVTSAPAGAGATDTPEDPVSTPAQPDAEDPFAASTSPGDDPFSSSVEDPFGTSTGDDPFRSTSSTTDDAFSSSDAEDPFARPAASDDTGADRFASQGAGTTEAEENPFVTDAPAAAESPAATEAAQQGALDEPEEQPFERNGKWFFRREGELLVYEEGTGEWIPADESDLQPAAPPPAATSTGYSTETTSQAGDLGAGEGGDTARFETVDEEPRPTAGGGFWKCPSCGAVNGSSATTCRMCFSARP